MEQQPGNPEIHNLEVYHFRASCYSFRECGVDMLTLAPFCLVGDPVGRFFAQKITKHIFLVESKE